MPELEKQNQQNLCFSTTYVEKGGKEEVKERAFLKKKMKKQESFKINYEILLFFQIQN